MKWFNENILDTKMILGNIIGFLALWGPEIVAVIVVWFIIKQVIIIKINI